MSDHGEHGEEAPAASFVYPEFKADIVELCQRNDRSVGQVDRDLDLTETSAREWVEQAGRDAGTVSHGGMTTEAGAAAAAEPAATGGRVILKRATAFVAGETW